MSANGDNLDCDKCGRRIDTTQDAFTDDEATDYSEHIDCNDPKGYNF